MTKNLSGNNVYISTNNIYENNEFKRRNDDLMTNSINFTDSSSNLNTSKMSTKNPILKENWQFKRMNNPSTSEIQFSNFKANNKYSSLADIYLDYTLNSNEQDNFRNDSTFFLNYPDILENSIMCNSLSNKSPILTFNQHTNQTNLNLSTIDFNELNQTEFNKNADYIDRSIDMFNDYDQNQDVISLNVDFSNDECLDQDQELQATTNNTNDDEETFKFELNPKKYTLELSTLSTSSKSSKPSSRSGSGSLSDISTTSSITYYDDFYVTNKINQEMIRNAKNDKNVQKFKSSSTFF